MGRYMYLLGMYVCQNERGNYTMYSVAVKPSFVIAVFIRFSKSGPIICKAIIICTNSIVGNFGEGLNLANLRSANDS